MTDDKPASQQQPRPFPLWADKALYVGLMFVGLFWLVWAIGVKSLVGTALDGAMGWLTLIAAIRFGALAKKAHDDC